MSVVARVGSLVAAVVLAASCGTTSSSTTTDSVNTSVIGSSSVTDSTVSVTGSTVNPADGLVEIAVTVGVDSGPNRIVQVPFGASVRVTIINPDAADEYHLHGYDIASGFDVPAGEKAVIEFEATKSGSFEIESHASQQVLIVLEIS